jgi:uncharacterized damage-inducible protein DinB
MKRFSMALAAAAVTVTAFAADEHAIFAKHWQTARDFTIAVAEAMPAADYGFKPNEAEMSFGKVMAHIAMANNGAFATVSGVKAPATPEKIAEAYRDPHGVFEKEATLAFLRESFDFCGKALEQITPEKLDALFGPEGRQTTGRERLWSGFTHMAHHRGQAEVYLRVKNIKPPDYRF